MELNVTQLLLIEYLSFNKVVGATMAGPAMAVPVLTLHKKSIAWACSYESASARVRPVQSVVSFPPGPAILVHLELAVQSTRAHPDNWKVKAKKLFHALRGLISTTHLWHCLINWPDRFLFASYGPVQLIGFQGVCNVLAVTWHCVHRCSTEWATVVVLSLSRVAGQHWYWQVLRVMRRWWMPYWREGPQWMCKMRYYSTGLIVTQLFWSASSTFPSTSWWLSHDIVFTGILTIHLNELLVVLPLQDGRTALMEASSEGHEVVVEALLKAGTTVDVQAKVLLYWFQKYCRRSTWICVAKITIIYQKNYFPEDARWENIFQKISKCDASIH